MDSNVTDAGLLIGAREGIRVLIADENAASQRVLDRMLSHWRMDTVAADGVEPALAAFDQAALDRQPFALVILNANISGGRGLELVKSLQLREAARGAGVIVLASAAEENEAEQYKVQGVRAYLQQPVTQPRLLEAINATLTAESLERLSAFSRSADGAVEASRVRRILVAESDPADRTLARWLEQRGHSVLQVSSGRKAVETLALEKFDIALLDILLPEVGVMEAAAAIRARERKANVARTFIVALTRDTARSNPAQYIAAGIDGCIEKPVHPDKLFNVVENLSIIQVSDPETAFDGTLFDGDPELLTEIVGLFLETYPQLVSTVEDAILRKDARGLCRAAHTLKGAVANFGAKAVVKQAASLEMMGKDGNLSFAVEGFARLRALLDNFEPQLRVALKKAMEQVVT